MALTEQERSIAQQLKEQGGTIEDFREAMDMIRSRESGIPSAPATRSAAPVDTPKPSPIQTFSQISQQNKQDIQNAPSFLGNSGESISNQFSEEGLIGHGFKQAGTAGEDIGNFLTSKPGEGKMDLIKGLVGTAAAGAQITAGVTQEVINQGLNAAGTLYGLGLEQLDAETLATLNNLSSTPVEAVGEFVKKPSVQKAIKKVGSVVESIPESYRYTADALLNLLPSKVATKNISLTEKAAKQASERIVGAGERLAAQVLQPGLSENLASGAFAKTASKVSTYKDLTKSIERERKATGEMLNKALVASTGVVSDPRVEKVIEFLDKGVKSEKDLLTLESGMEEAENIGKLLEKAKAGTLKTTDLQEVKNTLDDLYHIYSAKGDVAAGRQAGLLDKERKYVKELIEQRAPGVKGINTTYEGLREAEQASIREGARALKDRGPTPGVINTILQKIPGVGGMSPSAISKAEADLAKKTGEIKKLSEQAKKQKSVREALGIPSATERDVFKIPKTVEKPKFVLPGGAKGGFSSAAGEFDPIKGFTPKAAGFSPIKKAPIINIKKEIEKAKAEKLKFIPKKK